MQSDINEPDSSNNEIKTVIVVASYLEDLALPVLLSELSLELSNDTLVIIADDSPSDYFSGLKIKVEKQILHTELKVLWSHHPKKSGRGAAIKRGMEVALNRAPKFERLIECDADGSHTSKDIAKIQSFHDDFDVVIGSRYITGSAIVGWSVKRRLFSKLLNLIIPKLLNIHAHDVTNGLRMYSREAVKLICSAQINCPGFIYLSEQLLICKKNNLQVVEIPITFVNRTLGNSSVTKKEIIDSALGILKLWKIRK